jgi:serine O-acetyltransferase
MPSVEVLGQVMELLRTVLFPGYFGPSELRARTLKYRTGAALDQVDRLLFEQIRRGFCFACRSQRGQVDCSDCDARAQDLTERFLSELPKVRDLLATDAQKAFEGDPAAHSPGETVFCYPSMRAMTNHRIAHELYRLGVPLIPRIISEAAHSETGIDINPGATIGPQFFMDHGTGIVIGETAVIGKDVQIYQGVTLGARSFPLDGLGHPIKGIQRHPIVEDGVIIYAGATILGRIRIGTGSIVGGNVWLTHDVPPFTRIMQGKPIELGLTDGAGI